jgi:hypothetical protein
VLTKTQLRTAKTKELEQLQARIEAELESRRDEEQKQQAKTAEKEQLFYSGHVGHYQWEYVQCGNKERCRKCQAGQKHGPYLYRYFYKDGKQKSEYIKLSDLSKHPDAPSRPRPV